MSHTRRAPCARNPQLPPCARTRHPCLGRVHAVSFRMPGAPVVNWIMILFLLAVAAMLWLDPGTRVALYVAPFWFALLGLGYWRSSRSW